MTRKEPTPIRKPLVPVPADEPQPIKFPKPALTDEQLRNLVARYVSQILYKTAMQMSDVEIIEMGEQEFEAFCRSVLEEDA